MGPFDAPPPCASNLTERVTCGLLDSCRAMNQMSEIRNSVRIE